MLRVRSLSTLPGNFDAFQEEVAAILERLYGAKSAGEYRQNARRAMAANLAHPQVRALALLDGKTTAGITIAMLREGFAEIFFVHLLKAYQGRGFETRLLRDTLAMLHAENVRGILCECVIPEGMDIGTTLITGGLHPVPRQLMVADLDAAPMHAPVLLPVRPLAPTDSGSVAHCIVEAYRAQDAPPLHLEVQSLPNALDFLGRLQQGAYGPVKPGFQQVLYSGDRCAGAVLGCEVAPDTGFVLQLVVAPEFQGRGYAKALLHALATVYREAGYRRMALGVTCDNPALRLYEKLGFRVIQPVTAYVWWQAGMNRGLASAAGPP
ncbi:MAG: GNAT family N-acetyltransferase [Candidatus Hydrogenedentes bacterium]|nr:GNAT family N-acetyltransferase [Candidatus Hydrogenedentota bacterium]